ncbi:hypothetical protein R3I93_023075 [Phoxinus phoxinus]|uniref:Endonuclease domain-containing 1 protein n=1 Tax=Phoxinus phoxinus TaxID=58324 RepID=A0AAN9GRD7_9TELE
MKLLVFLLLPCLSLSEVVPEDVTGFGECDQFFLNNDPPRFTPELPNTQKICQCVWDENDEQKYLYATLYNTDWRIPVYSAYVFYRSISVGRCNPWYIEPQLDGDAEPCMAPKGRKKRDNQAVNKDYEKQDPNKPKYDKGHLYPVQHTYDHVSMLATSTLTNAAPQNSHFNQYQWKEHEKAVATALTDCAEAYVVTGVVPDPDPNKKLNKIVTVSKYYWRATCCLKNGVYTGTGYFGPNNNDKVEELTITELQNKLAKDYGVTIVIFPSIPIPTGSKRPFPGVTGGCI